MRRPSHYEIVGPGVLDYVDEFANDEVYEAFYDLVEALQVGPCPDDDPSLGVMSLRDSRYPNGFTAPFGGATSGLLAYQVMLDQPVIKLIDAFWIDDDNPEVGTDYAF